MSSKPLLVVLNLAMAALLGGAGAHAETSARRIVLKSGESVELHTVYWVVNCRSILVGMPELEVIEGPEQVTLAIKEGKVIPRRQNCANPVAGGTLVATAKDITEPMEAKLTYRVKYKTKDGDRQLGHVYSISLYP
jgi:hypothetical protein